MAVLVRETRNRQYSVFGWLIGGPFLASRIELSAEASSQDGGFGARNIFDVRYLLDLYISVALPPRKAENNPKFLTFRTLISVIRNGPNGRNPYRNFRTRDFPMSEIPESDFPMSEIPEAVCRKVGIPGIGDVRFRKFLLLV